MTTAQLTNEQYDERRRFLEDIKILTKPEHEKLFQILRESGAEFSENSNGIFFDVSKISETTFSALKSYMKYCHDVRHDQAKREQEMDDLR